MHYNINKKIIPLCENLILLDIGNYLISDNFKKLLDKFGIADVWSILKRYIISQDRCVILHPGYPGYDEIALIYFLSITAENVDIVSLNFIEQILVDFTKYSPEKKDFTKVGKCLVDLGYDKKDVKSILSKISYSNKLEKIVKRKLIFFINVLKSSI
ncbi:hypothetical protein [Methanococcus voltae]|uniref:Uncharacterized protein n=1 Tax=Methanococcus voltae (strain ATCC BAA-1334 / A3) TaxID=456320 RepID=D7DQR4_METV3|nr:hypothetical protein [Methanococcus voltae]MCS3900851.1 hypothetical protein [Methanococcus voltae]